MHSGIVSALNHIKFEKTKKICIYKKDRLYNETGDCKYIKMDEFNELNQRLLSKSLPG